MKLLIDVADNKADKFMALIKDHSYVKAKQISVPDAELLNEIKEINKALSNAEKIKAGKIKSRPASEFLNEL